MNLFRILLLLAIIFCIQNSHAIQLKKIKTYYGAGAPKSVEVSPNGNYAVIMNLEAMNLWIIDTNTLKKREIVSFYPFRTSAKGHNYKTKKAIASFAEKPVECAFAENGKYVWTSFHNGSCVVRLNTENPNEIVTTSLAQKAKLIKNSKKLTIKLPKIKVGKTPKIVAVTPDQKYILVANWFGNSVSIIDNNSLKKIKDIKIGTNGWRKIPRGICINSTSTKAYIANMGGGTISTIDLTTLKKIDDFKISRNPRHIAISKDDNYLLITDNRGGLVIKYDINSKKIVNKKYIGAQARTLSLSPDNKYIYAVSHRDNKIVILDFNTLKIIKKYKYYRPMGISVSPNGKQLWVTSYTGGYVSVFTVIE